MEDDMAAVKIPKTDSKYAVGWERDIYIIYKLNYKTVYKLLTCTISVGTIKMHIY